MVGGLGWPWGDRAGFALVLAESRLKDESLKKHHYWVLDDFETFNPGDLLAKCAIFKKTFYVGQIYGDTTNKPMMDFLYKLNIATYLTKPPFIDDPNCLNSYIA